MLHTLKKLFIKDSIPQNIYHDTFLGELNYQSHKIMLLVFISSFSWLSYIPVDRTLFPDESLIVVLRICFPIAGTTIYILHRLPFFKDKQMYLLTYFGAHMAITCAILTGLTKGHPAYVGGFLFVLTLLALGPVKMIYPYIILYTSVVTFFIIAHYKGMTFSDPVSRYSINDLIAVTGIISVFIYILNNIRYKNWEKSKIIEMNRRIIQNQNSILENQIELAGELQKKLLPEKIPEMKNAFASYIYLPMMKVGGDFIDIYYDKEKNELGLFVCDVSGHGIAAAFIASMVKMVLSNWKDYLHQPEKMLTLLYHSLVDKLSSQFITILIGYVDLHNRIARFSRAGHHPALLIRNNETIEYILPGGKMINQIANPEYEVVEITLMNNDKIILYTDGILDCFNEKNIIFGEEAFIKLLKHYSNQKPEQMVQSIIHHINEYVGATPFHDDITLLVMEYYNE